MRFDTEQSYLLSVVEVVMKNGIRRQVFVGEFAGRLIYDTKYAQTASVTNTLLRFFVTNAVCAYLDKI